MKYALLKYKDGETNIGDYIQSLAAQQFLPKTDKLISREFLNQEKEVLKLILNGWFMHSPNNWPPSTSIIPKFISFHISNHLVEKMTTPACIAYYKQHGPIGCRDKYTRNKLQEKGVDAYFSGCLTLTLNKKDYSNKPNNNIIFSDILFHKNDEIKKRSLIKRLRNPHKIIINTITNYYKNYSENKLRNKVIGKLIPQNIINSAINISNQNLELSTHDEKFNEAKRLLSVYASAKFVVTSRIHVALPCIAFGTPVIFIRPERATSRFEGITDLFNTFTLEKIKNTPKEMLQKEFIEASKNVKTEHLMLRANLIKEVNKFIG